jgi:hypothetical protein
MTRFNLLVGGPKALYPLIGKICLVIWVGVDRGDFAFASSWDHASCLPWAILIP